ncbi:MAG: tetratricopeptide repeat protein [Candidatus Electrothrix sp. Rat3]|nr:tetratricopeptide repeat protein [Candidatus Electrothrix rattekaaiensis]
MTLSGYINTFLLLTVLSIHTTIVSAQEPAQSVPESIIFTATPDNYSLLGNSDTLKREYRERLNSFLNQGNLQNEANIYCILGDLENVTRKFSKAETDYSEAISRYDQKDNFLGLGRVWYGRGEIERKSNRYDKAEEAYKKANHYYERANSRQGRAAVQLALGHIKRNTVGPKEARSFYESAQDLYEAQEGQRGEANVFCALGDLECSLGNYEKSEEAYDKATSLYSKKNNVLGLANVFIGRGDLARVRNDIPQALAFYKKAAGHYKTIQDDLGRANALAEMGHLERKLTAQYHWDNSSNHYVIALEIYKDIKDTLGIANVLAGQGDLATLRGNHERIQKNEIDAKRYHETAETNYLSAKKYYEELGDKLGQANVILGLGRLEAIRGKLRSALKKCVQAENIYRALNNLLGLANALTERGHLQIMLGKTEVDRILSLNTYKEAKALYSDLENQLGEAHVLCGIGWLEKKSGDLEDAENTFKEARCLYKRLQNQKGIDITSQFLGEIAAKRKEQLAQVPPGTPIITNPPSEEVRDQISPLVEADKTHLIETVKKIWSELKTSIKAIRNTCKNISYSICEYLLRNLDWLFSGGMISIMGALLIIRRNKKKSSKQNDKP